MKSIRVAGLTIWRQSKAFPDHYAKSGVRPPHSDFLHGGAPANEGGSTRAVARACVRSQTWSADRINSPKCIPAAHRECAPTYIQRAGSIHTVRMSPARARHRHHADPCAIRPPTYLHVYLHAYASSGGARYGCCCSWHTLAALSLPYTLSQPRRRAESEK